LCFLRLHHWQPRQFPEQVFDVCLICNKTRKYHRDTNDG
jgi:hypothetical protein